MKKTLNVNLNGRVFTIDDDAYGLLDNYLTNLRIYFRKEEGAAEIIADFEARIEELFSEKTRLGHQVITLEHVEEVISRVGKPGDFADSEEKEEEKKRPSVEPEKGKKKFFRNVDDKLLGGVCSGIAAYFGWNVIAIRLILIISPFVLSSLTFLSFHHPLLFFSGNIWFWIVLAYLITWLVVPAAQTAEQKLQMHGKPITVENIGKTVAAQSAPVTASQPKGCLEGIVDLFVSFLKVCLAGLGCLIGLPLLFALFIVVVVLIAVLLGVGGGLLGVGGGLLGAMPAFLLVKYPVLFMIAGILLVGIPVFALIYSIIAHFAKAKPMNQSVKWTFIIIWILSLVLFFFSGFRTDRHQWKHHKWNWSTLVDKDALQGNNIPSQKTIDFNEAVTCLEVGKYVVADIQIEQSSDEAPSIEINGDENLVEQIRHDLQNGRLILTSFNRLSNNNNLKIKLRTNALKSVHVGFVGNVRMNRAFVGDEFEIKMKGVGNFQADSLFVNRLTARSEGVGSIRLSGKADKANLETAGTGKVDALDFRSDTIYAKVDGVGSINCYPVEYLEGRVNGVGSILYKEEPAKKSTNTIGIGRIRKK